MFEVDGLAVEQIVCGFVMIFDSAPVNLVQGCGSFGDVHSEGGCVDGEACLVEVLLDEEL